jgi:hypothetical protein
VPADDEADRGEGPPPSRREGASAEEAPADGHDERRTRWTRRSCTRSRACRSCPRSRTPAKQDHHSQTTTLRAERAWSVLIVYCAASYQQQARMGSRLPSCGADGEDADDDDGGIERTNAS